MNSSDKREVLDAVRRGRPISFRELMSGLTMYPRDDVFLTLEEHQDAGRVRRIEGDIEEHGTTERLWVATDE